MADTSSEAIVIGGSMAGLATAQVLSRHFQRVYIVDRDTFPEGAVIRKGVPQARHIHVLLGRGRKILEKFFPGFQDEMVRSGAHLVNLGADIAWYGPGGWKKTYRSGITGPTSSRELLEWTIRARVRDNPRVRFVESADVTGLLHEEDRGRVVGVRYRHRDGHEGEATMRAGLVVDASGRSSKTPQWLEALGYPVPEQTIVNSFLGYASRIYEPPAGWKSTWKMLMIQASPPASLRGGILMPIEGNRWIVTLAGLGKEYPPTDEEGFMEFAHSLRSPLLYQALQRATPLGDIAGYRRTENHWRHYERLKRRPENFIVIGDAVCAFNPVYGQGMTTGALGAERLGDMLTRHLRDHPGSFSGLATRFQKSLSGGNMIPWLLATSEDFRCPITEGGKPSRATRLAQSYFTRVLERASASEQVCEALFQVTHLLKHPAVLFGPGVMLRMLLPASERSSGAAPRHPA